MCFSLLVCRNIILVDFVIRITFIIKEFFLLKNIYFRINLSITQEIRLFSLFTLIRLKWINSSTGFFVIRITYKIKKKKKLLFRRFFLWFCHFFLNFFGWFLFCFRTFFLFFFWCFFFSLFRFLILFPSWSFHYFRTWFFQS